MVYMSFRSSVKVTSSISPISLFIILITMSSHSIQPHMYITNYHFKPLQHLCQPLNLKFEVVCLCSWQCFTIFFSHSKSIKFINGKKNYVSSLRGCLAVWQWLLFKQLFVPKYMPMMFFHFLKIIFYISTSKRSKKYKPHSILAKKKNLKFDEKQAEQQSQTGSHSLIHFSHVSFKAFNYK